MKEFTAVLVSLGLLAGASADKFFSLPSKDPAPYHDHVRAVAATMPDRVGDWVGKDLPAEGAKDYLRANVFLQRQFTNVVTGQQVLLLLVQCPDVRNLVPHYPAVCYPSRGMSQRDALAREWVVKGTRIVGTEYHFESDSFRQANAIVVDNFMVLPGGQIAPDMKMVKAQVALRNRYYGVGQIQVVFSAETPEQKRDEIFRELAGAHKPLIDAISAVVVE